MDDEQTASATPHERTRLPRRWVIVAGGLLAMLLIVAVVLAVVRPWQPRSPSDATPAAEQAAGQPPTSATAVPRPSASARDDSTDAESVTEDDEQQAVPPAAPLPAAPPPAAPAPAAPAPAAPAPAAPAPVAPAPPAQPVLPPPPPPVITPTVATFTATNYNESSKTIAQGCAASTSGELAVRITWATANTTPTIAFRTQISGSPPVDNTITGYATSGENHFLQLRCAKIAYVTMTLHSDSMERQARLTIDGNGSAGWSYLS